MTEQERPRTEADGLRDYLKADPEMDGVVDRIEEAARTEGRQQVAEAIAALGEMVVAVEAFPGGDMLTSRARAILDRVAGLNASESPHYIGDDCTEDDLDHTEWFERDDGPRGIGDGEVFDSETFMAGARASRNNRAEIERGDASESGQPRPHIESCENETRVWFNDHGRCQCWCHDAEHENRRMLEAMRASRGDASEAGRRGDNVVTGLAALTSNAGDTAGWADVRDASESGQPPEAQR